MPTNLHTSTPALTVIDPRALPVRAVAYHRLLASEQAEARINRQRFDAAGRLKFQWDPRLWADGGESGTPNQALSHSLAGQVIGSDSVDAGWRLGMQGEAGQLLASWDGRGNQRIVRYDDFLRPASAHESLAGSAALCVERFTYGAGDDSSRNRCGRVIRHDDPAGTRLFPDYGVQGPMLAETQVFLQALDTPDWPEAMEARDALLETGAPGLAQAYTTGWRRNALGQLLEQVDAQGNRQCSRYDIAGAVYQSDLQPVNAAAPTTLASSITYNALGQQISQVAGNGVCTQAEYSSIDGRLQRLCSTRTGKVLQDLHYEYDGVGNVVRVDDQVQPTQWFDGAQVAGVSTYAYDSLSQLIQATGRESVQAGIQPELPGLVIPGGGDVSRLRPYTQQYHYDTGGNLLTLNHSGTATRRMRVAERSNRSLWVNDDDYPPDLEAGFDANGNQGFLIGTQAMAWDARNQLRQVTQVAREGGADDHETYLYGGGGLRKRKVRCQQARALIHIEEVRYLPGLEIRRNTATGEALHVLTAAAGRGKVRYLNWEANRKALPSAQLRYSLDDHLGSSSLELDEQGNVISHEGYYPFGGTAWWAARNQTEASYKTHRYSGKEHDATGLYYYGFRYYAPWLQRWINPDPAGDVDGLNLFAFVRNNPASLVDSQGLVGTQPPDVEMINLGYEGYENLGYIPGAPPLSYSSSYEPRSLLPSIASSSHSQALSPSPFETVPSPIEGFDLNQNLELPDSPFSVSSELARLGPDTPRTPGLVFGTDDTGPSSGLQTTAQDTSEHANASTAGQMLPPTARPAAGRKCTQPGCHRFIEGFREQFQDHLRTHRGEKPYKCDHCGKNFAQPSNLVAHQKTHRTDVPPDYICEVPGCGKGFLIKSNFQEHSATHSDDRPFICGVEGCNSRFKLLRTLRIHGLTHIEQPPVNCATCGASLKHNRMLAQHMKRVHRQ